MTASQLCAKLQQLISDFGDLKVRIDAESIRCYGSEDAIVDVFCEAEVFVLDTGCPTRDKPLNP